MRTIIQREKYFDYLIRPSSPTELIFAMNTIDPFGTVWLDSPEERFGPSNVGVIGITQDRSNLFFGHADREFLVVTK